MKNEITEKKLDESKPLVTAFELVEREPLILVKVINAKVFEQIPRETLGDVGEGKRSYVLQRGDSVLGLVEKSNDLLVRRGDNDHLLRLSASVYLDQQRRAGRDYPEVNAELKKLPQLFIA